MESPFERQKLRREKLYQKLLVTEAELETMVDDLGLYLEDSATENKLALTLKIKKQLVALDEFISLQELENSKAKVEKEQAAEKSRKRKADMMKEMEVTNKLVQYHYNSMDPTGQSGSQADEVTMIEKFVSYAEGHILPENRRDVITKLLSNCLKMIHDETHF